VPIWQALLLIWQTGRMHEESGQALTAVGRRLRALRKGREITLADLSEATGISVSTLSRLESGARRPTLELLLPRRARMASRRRGLSTPCPRGSALPGLSAQDDDYAAAD
jgi:DNA-binding XRE family transcriptional regulator